MASLKDLLVTGTARILGKIYAGGFVGNLSGNADSATKASKDSANQQINSTYIKSLSVSGRTITITKGDNSTSTITTQDTDTWRGIQDNLTSTATNQSLSANQGRVLKGLVDGKAASSHGHGNASASANGFMSNTDKAKLDSGDVVYVGKATPSKACIWVKLD